MKPSIIAAVALILVQPVCVRADPPVIHRAPAIDQSRLPTRPPAFIKPCDELEREEPELSVARLAPDRLLWIRTCGFSDYNKASRLYLTDERGKRLAAASDGPLFPEGEDLSPVAGLSKEIFGELPDFTNVTYAPASRTLASTGYATPQRDSGSREEYVWDGRRFRHARSMELEQTQERGRKPTLWPVTHQTRVVDTPKRNVRH